MQRLKVMARCNNGLWLGTLETLNFFLVEAVGRLPPAVATIEDRSTGLLGMVGMGQSERVFGKRRLQEVLSSYGNFLDLNTFLGATGCTGLPEDSWTGQADVGRWSFRRRWRFWKILVVVIVAVAIPIIVAAVVVVVVVVVVVHPGSGRVYARRWSARPLDARTSTIQRWF